MAAFRLTSWRAERRDPVDAQLRCDGVFKRSNGTEAGTRAAAIGATWKNLAEFDGTFARRDQALARTSAEERWWH